MDLTDCPLIGDPVDIEGMKKGIFDYDNPNAIVVHPVGESGFFTPFHIKYKVLHSTCYYDPTDIDTELLFDIKDNNQLRQFLRSVIVASGWGKDGLTVLIQTVPAILLPQIIHPICYYPS